MGERGLQNAGGGFKGSLKFKMRGEKMDEEKDRKIPGWVYSIKGGWQMLTEMREMSNLKPRKGLLKKEDLVEIPYYFGFFPIEYYLPGYVEVGRARTGVLAGPRGKELTKLINKEIKEKCKDKEYIVIKSVGGYTIYYRIFVRKEDETENRKDKS